MIHKFSAVASHPDLPGGRAEASIEVGGSSLILRVENQEVSLPYAGLSVSAGGANNKLIFFSHPSLPTWSCYTRETKILNELQKTSAAGLVSDFRNEGRRRSLEWLTFAIVVLLIVFVLWKAKDPLVDTVTFFVPKTWESRAGDVIYSTLASTRKVIEDKQLDTDFEKIVAPLTNVLQDSGYTFKFHLIDEDELNAAALPGGHVLVHSSIILKANRAEEVLGVLAHELAHVTHRHTVKQLFSIFGLYFVFDIVFGNVAGTLAALSQAAPYLLEKGFSRAYEDEADRAGFEYLLKANINPNGMVDFFKLLAEEEQSVPVVATIDKHLSFLSTHPGTEERIEKLERKVKEHESTQYQTLPDTFAKFQADLRAKLGE